MSNLEYVDEDQPRELTMIDAADASLAVGLSRAEIDTQISTARRFPRELKAVQTRLMSYVTLDEETAEECMYALPRGGKPIKGASIRFAEALKASFGNCRAAARVVFVDRAEKVVIAEGVFHDLETNSASKAEVRRRICDRRGRLFSDDMIIVTGNAACSIALRNAILGGVPKPVWRRAYEAVQQTIVGDVKTLSETRDRAVKALAAFGATPEQIYQAIGVAGSEDITVDHIPTLRGMFAALKNGEATVEEMFAGTTKGITHQTVADPLSDEAPKSQNTDLSQEPQPQTPQPEMTPASDPVPDAGTNSPEAGHVTGDDDARGGSEDGNPTPASDDQPSLPDGWEKEYAAALRKAVKPDSVEKYAKMFWADRGGWKQWKDTSDGVAGTIIFNAFRDHFGKKADIDAVLREVGAL